MSLPALKREPKQEHIKILHYLPGRIRLGLYSRKLHLGETGKLENSLLKLGGIREVSINPVTSSILVLFDEKKISATGIIHSISQQLKTGHRDQELQPSPVTTHLSLNIKYERLLPALLGIILGNMKGLRPFKPDVLINLLMNKKEMEYGYKAFINGENDNPDYYLFLSLLFEVIAGRSKFRLGAFLIHEFSSLIRETLENYNNHQFQRIFPEIPELLKRLNDAGNSESVSSLSIRTGDRIVYSKGQQVFTDAEVVQGIADIEQHTVTGLDQNSRVKTRGAIKAGNTVKEGKLLVKVAKPPHQTTLMNLRHRIDFGNDHLETIHSSDHKKHDLKSRFLQSLLFAALTRDIISGMRLISSGFNTGIKRNTSLVSKTLVAKALHKGTLIGDSQKIIGSFKTPVILLDNMESIYETEYRVKTVMPVVLDAKPSRILELAAASEEGLYHPIAQAINSHITKQNLPVPNHSKPIHLPGLGTETVIDDLIVRVGSKNFMQQRAIALKHAHDVSDYIESRGWKPLFVSIDQRVFGVIGLEKTLNREAHGFINAVRDQVSPHCYLLSDSTAWYRETINKVLPGNKYQPSDQDDFFSMLKRQQIKTTMLTTDKHSGKRFENVENVIHLGKNNLLDNLDANEVCVYSGDLHHLFWLLTNSRSAARLLQQNLNSTIVLHLVRMVLSQNRLISNKWNPVLHEIITLLNTLNVFRFSLNR